MDAQALTLPWGNETIQLSLPPAWPVAGHMIPSALPGVADTQAETRRALQNPVGLPALASLVKPGARVALVIDDHSRPTPQKLLLPAVLAELERGGLRRDCITVVLALGVHLLMNEQEILARLGPEVLSGLQVENTSC